MKIGFLTERMTMGYGVAVVTDRLAEGLSKLGHDVTVYTVFNDDTYQGGEYGLVTLDIRTSIVASLYESRAEKVVGQEFANGQDVWIVESFPFFKAASRFQRPWIAFDHGVVPAEYFPLLKRSHLNYIRRTQYRDYLQKASGIVCVSKFLLDSLPPILRKKAVVIYPGINHYPNRSMAVDLRKELGIAGVVILYVGRPADTAPYKGVRMLLDAYSILRMEMKDLRLVIAGPCSYEEQKRLGDEGVTVVNGPLPQFMSSVFRCGDLYATATQWEGFDLPLLEASYFGLPVVALSIGAHPEIVRNGETGFLVKDRAEFIDRMKQLVQDSDLRKQMGLKGSKYAAEFTWNRAAEAFDRLVRETGDSAGQT
jgi:glycosyltransferase involved in cell wall biosynthesis